MKKNKEGGYVVIHELPKEQQEPFKLWLEGQTVPIVEDEGENKLWCAFKYDYDKFLRSWKVGLVAPSID